MKQIWTIFFVLGCILLVSCTRSNSTTNVQSSVAQLTSFSFAKHDSFPGLAEAKFYIKELLDTGLVYNRDSMRYGTCLDSVVPKFTFYTTPYTTSLRFSDPSVGKDTVFALHYNDTLNFNHEYIYLTVLSADQSTTKVYRILPTVHQVDPDLYVWNTLCESVHPVADETQQMLFLGDRMLIFSNDGLQTRLFASSDLGRSWSSATTVSTLPTDCRVRTIVALDDALYYVQGTQLYTSTDGATWSATDCSSLVSTFHSALLAWIDCVWVIGERADGSLALFTVLGTTVEDSDITLDDTFPVSGFAAVAFTSTSDRARAMVMGGISREGAYLNSCWNMEYSLTHKTMAMTNYAKEQPDAPAVIGASLTWYNRQLCLLGGVDEKGGLHYTDGLYVSKDEGMHWSLLDTTKCHLPETLTPRYNASVCAHDNTIYIYGGQSRTRSFSDLYSTRLQSIDWEK